MNITYQEIKPSAALQPYVDAYWIQSFEGARGEHSPEQFCIPLGMAEIIVTLDDGLYEISVNDQWFALPDIFICGMYPDKVTWRAESNTRKFGVRLKPETLHMLFKAPSSVLYSDYTVLENVVGSEANLLLEQLVEAPDLAAIIACTETFLLKQLNKYKQEHSYVLEAAELIRSSKGNLSIDTVCKSVYVSPRQLQRSFQQAMGLSPKTYQRVIRFRNVYRDMYRKQQTESWAGLSYDHGYADQAHFIREFKEFTGFIPTELLSNKTHIHGLAESVRVMAYSM